MRGLAVAVVIAAVAAGCGGEESGLPYSAVGYDAADARRVFAREGVNLTPRSRAPSAITTLGDGENILEVDVFGAPERVRQTGFRDVRRGRSCTAENRLAVRWRGNVRAIVDCDLAGRHEREWVERMSRALARL